MGRQQIERKGGGGTVWMKVMEEIKRNDDGHPHLAQVETADSQVRFPQ
jgi:hypothetical protein